MSSPPPAEEAAILVRRAARALARHGLATAYGHCSLRTGPDSFVVCPPKPMSLILPGEACMSVPVDGPLPAGALGAVRVHQQAYKLRPDVAAVCRFMSPKVMSLSALGRTPRALHAFGSYFAPAPPLWSDPTVLRSSENAVGTAKALGAARAVVIRGNGALTVGRSMEEAVVLAWFLEDAARVEMDVLQTHIADQAIEYTPEEAAGRAVFDGNVIERMWAYLTEGDPE